MRLAPAIRRPAQDDQPGALHTRGSLVPAIIERTKASHPYEVLCVVALPILDGNPDYLTWIEQETHAPDQP